jgi:hypothetical protein
MQAAVAAHQSIFADEPLPCCQLSTSSSSLSAPSSQHHPVLPVISTHYTPSVFLATNQASPLRDQLLAFVTSGKEKRIGFTPDARHLIVDTGASITITNAVTDFDHSPQPVKPTQSKGIASGLQVLGLGQATYCFIADSSKVVSITLQNVLMFPIVPSALFARGMLLKQQVLIQTVSIP